MAAVIKRARGFAAASPSRLAIVEPLGSHRTTTYKQLVDRSASLAAQIMPFVKPDVHGRQPRIAHLCPRDSSYVVAQWAAWQAGTINVPMAEKTSQAEWEHVLKDSAPAALLVHKSMAPTATAMSGALKIPCVVFDPLELTKPAPPVVPSATAAAGNDGALFIYTSGTTGKPKGVLHTHKSVSAQIEALVSTWKWTKEDHILNTLPLNHVHGIINVVACALYSGAVLDMHPSFEAAKVWEALVKSDHESALSLFMAVPTIYVKLIDFFDMMTPEQQSHILATMRSQPKMRLMVSGSAALPLSVLRRWKEISGFHLLERYGMSEFGMAISNHIGTDAEDSSVGWPLPGVQCRLVKEDSGEELTALEATGELQVKGNNVFKEYFNRPEATAEAFTADGWFKTGDLASRGGADGRYYIRGRLSMDIIKSGGYKLSALEIERVLLEHPAIAECIVLGVPDAVYGERVAAVIVPKPASVSHLSPSQWDNKTLSRADSEFRDLAAVFDLHQFCASMLAPYKVPSIVRLVSEIPRNAMGKVNKKSVRQALFS